VQNLRLRGRVWVERLWRGFLGPRPTFNPNLGSAAVGSGSSHSSMSHLSSVVIVSGSLVTNQVAGPVNQSAGISNPILSIPRCRVPANVAPSSHHYGKTKLLRSILFLKS
jgi:hypothetical protein